MLLYPGPREWGSYLWGPHEIQAINTLVTGMPQLTINIATDMPGQRQTDRHVSTDHK